MELRDKGNITQTYFWIHLEHCIDLSVDSKPYYNLVAQRNSLSPVLDNTMLLCLPWGQLHILLFWVLLWVELEGLHAHPCVLGIVETAKEGDNHLSGTSHHPMVLLYVFLGG